MIPELGLISFIILLFFVSFEIGFLFYLLNYKTNYNLLFVMRYLSVGQFFLVFLSCFTIVLSFFNDDFTLLYVYSNSNSSLPLIYKISALWASHEGSFLLFIFIFIFWIYLYLKFSGSINVRLLVCTIFFLSILVFLFLIFLLFTSNPFERITHNFPIDGVDLNPLLQDIGLIIHPPILYMGYIGFSIPFSFVISSLFLKQFDFISLKYVYGWILLSFSFLTGGITFGSWWAYYELGWGGWWFWDPVENISLVPWLSCLALIHSLFFNVKKNEFSKLSIFLVILTYLFCLLGIFFVRSGLISSVHSFTDSSYRGLYLFLLFLFIFFVSFFLYIFRIFSIKFDNFKFGFSRASVLLFIIILIFISIFTILLGTYYPLFVDYFFYKRLSVGAPYYLKTVVPVFVFVLFFIPLGVVLNWSFVGRFNRYLMYSIFFSILLSLLALFFLENKLAIFGFFLCIWIFLGCILYFLKYKLYDFSYKYFLDKMFIFLFHFFVIFIVLGINISAYFSVEKDVVLKVGDKVSVSNYEFVFNKFFTKDGCNYVSDVAEIVVLKNNSDFCKLYPERRLYFVSGATMTETAIYIDLFFDLYISLNKSFDVDYWSFRLHHKPFVRFIWLGGILLMVVSFFRFISLIKNIDCR